MKNTESKKNAPVKEKKEKIDTASKTQKQESRNEIDNPDDGYITMDMPEVKDIPGQEKIRPPKMREMIDSTPSSADEEGEGLLDDLNREDNDDDIVNDDNNNVSRTERRMLRRANQQLTDEEKDLNTMKLDSSDGEDPLNEKSNPRDMGEDLDVPGAELDDSDEEIGNEDEENNSFSRPD